MTNVNANNFFTALDLSYRFLKFRLRSEHEIRDYLKRKSEKYKLTEEDIDKTIANLKENNLINDHEFIEWFVNSRMSNKPKSQWVLRSELIRHGIDKSLIEEYFENNKINEEDLAYKALKRRWANWSYMKADIRFKKAAGFLKNRGFSFDLIKKAVAKLEEKS